MKAKLIIFAVMLAAAVGGYWVGSYRTAQSWNRIVDGQIHNRAHTEVKNRGQVNLHLLNYLHDGKLSEATDVLERQLDVAVTRCAAYWSSVPPDERDGSDMLIIRDARAYRSRHPWTNDTQDIAEGVQKAFKMAD